MGTAGWRTGRWWGTRLSWGGCSTRPPRVAGSSAPLREALHLELAQEAFEEAAVPLLVPQDGDDHVLRDVVDSVRDLDDAVVVLDRTGLGLDHALDDVHDVGLLLRRLEVRLLRAELERARHD